MSKQIKFYVFGGQYEFCCYGGTPTLIGARRLASKNMEYWDNWQGWHKPRIYLAEDTYVVKSFGRVTSYDGQLIRLPKPGSIPIL